MNKFPSNYSPQNIEYLSIGRNRLENSIIILDYDLFRIYEMRIRQKESRDFYGE